MKTLLEDLRVSKKKPFLKEVYGSLKKSILQGKLKAVQRFNEEQLADQIGIGRTPPHQGGFPQTRKG